MSASLQGRLSGLPPFSWRSDPAVPAFPDTRPLIVFDGFCVLCSGFARFVAERDRSGFFLFTAAQSPLGQALYHHFRMDGVNYESNLLLADGRAFAKMSAFAGVMSRLGAPWRIAAALDMLPARLTDRAYDLVAGNRYRLFGRHAACVRPNPIWRARMIE